MGTTDRQDLAQVGDSLAMSTTDTRAEQIEVLAEHFRAFENWHCIEGAHRERAEMLLDSPIRDIERAAAAKAWDESASWHNYEHNQMLSAAEGANPYRADRIEGGQ